jgi:hypothetical protein
MLITLERKNNKSETNSANFNLENVIKSIEIQKKSSEFSSSSTVTNKKQKK